MSLSQYTRRVFDECRNRSEDRIHELRDVARHHFGTTTEFLIGVNGSYARREATRGSDIDCFFLSTGSDVSSVAKRQAQFRQFVQSELALKLPASEGVFHKPLPVDEICGIGGQDDNNVTLTRRMLLLLEGEWLFNEHGFHDVRNRLLEKYLHDRPGDDKICMFLLNDIIRYWRTICIDLEHKVYASDKPREIRLIKLRFSRLLLYVSGVLTIGDGYGRGYASKMRHLNIRLGTYPIKRIQSIVGDDAIPVFDFYAEFLEALDTPDIRRSLESDGPNSRIFDEMRHRAGDFRDSLHRLFLNHLSDDNPTIRALLL